MRRQVQTLQSHIETKTGFQRYPNGVWQSLQNRFRPFGLES